MHSHKEGRLCPMCLEASRASVGIAPGCNPMESRVVRLFAVLLFVIAVCAVVVDKFGGLQ